MTAPKDTVYLIPAERIDSAILEIRGEREIVDYDLAAVYGVSTKALNQAVRRNRKRFPEDFAFQLNEAEKDELVTNCDRLATLKYSSSLPYAFTEHGAVMLASVLRSRRAVEVSVFVVKAFIRMRRMLADQRQLAIRLSELERKLASHDKNFQMVFAALRKLVPPPEHKKRRIGFATGPDDNIVARDRPRRSGSRRPQRFIRTSEFQFLVSEFWTIRLRRVTSSPETAPVEPSPAGGRRQAIGRRLAWACGLGLRCSRLARGYAALCQIGGRSAVSQLGLGACAVTESRRLDQSLVLVVGADPEPAERVAVQNRQSAIATCDAHGPYLTRLLETERRVKRIRAPDSESPPRAGLDVSGQGAEQRPKLTCGR